MLTANEKRLLQILLVVSILIGLFLCWVGLNTIFGMYKSKTQSLELEYTLQEKLLSGMEDVALKLSELKARQSSGIKKKYLQGEMDDIKFAQIINDLLSSYLIKVSAYEFRETQGKPSIEYKIKGSLGSFIDFLEKIEDSEYDWRLTSMNLRSQGNSDIAEVIFRIRYEME